METCTYRLPDDTRCGGPATRRMHFLTADGWRPSNVYTCSTHTELATSDDSAQWLAFSPRLHIVTVYQDGAAEHACMDTEFVLAHLDEVAWYAVAEGGDTAEWSGNLLTITDAEGQWNAYSIEPCEHGSDYAGYGDFEPELVQPNKVGTQMNFTHPTHRWVALGWNAFACKDCGLGSYEAEGIVCPGHDVWTCGTQSNARDHGTCFEFFDSPQAANEHFLATHARGRGRSLNQYRKEGTR